MLQQVYLEAPEALPLRFIKAWNERDPAGIANLFAEDASFVNVVGLWWNDRAAIWRAHEYGLRVIFPDSRLELRKTQLRIISDEAAVVQARMKLSAQSSHGNLSKPAFRMNVFTFVLEKRVQGWVCVAAQNTDIVPGKETNIVDQEGNLKAVDYRKK